MIFVMYFFFWNVFVWCFLTSKILKKGGFSHWLCLLRFESEWVCSWCPPSTWFYQALVHLCTVCMKTQRRSIYYNVLCGDTFYFLKKCRLKFKLLSHSHKSHHISMQTNSDHQLQIVSYLVHRDAARSS